MYNGVIISSSPPSSVTGYAWVKPLDDGTREWYHLDKDTQSWVLDDTEEAPALLVHEHATHGNINFTGTVSSGSIAGVTVNFDCKIAGVNYRIKKLEVVNGIVTKLTIEEDV